MKIESHKVNVNAKAKVGSLDNVGHEPGSNNVKVVINNRGYYIPLSLLILHFHGVLSKASKVPTFN